MKSLAKKLLPPAVRRAARETLDGLKKPLRIAGRFCGNCYPPGTKFLGDPVHQLFFGYYDVTPFSSDGKILLAMRAPGANISPHDHHPELEIGFFNLTEENPAFVSLATTKTWNWQQGCRLQWFDEDHIIYNVNGGSVVQNIRMGEIVKKFPVPVYALDAQRNFALSLDFASLHKNRRGYGYSNIPVNGSGITRLDLRSGETKEIVTLSDLGANCYINHLAFNPSGTRFLAFRISNAALKKRDIELVTANADGSGLYIAAPGIRPSHYAWMDDNDLLITGIKDGKAIYATVRDKTQDVEIMDSHHLREDGHPSLLKDGSILSDTYPDRFGHQKLFRYHPETDKRENIGSFYAPPGFTGEMRCDLHPRLSPAQDKICIDMVVKGRRALCVIPREGA